MDQHIDVQNQPSALTARGLGLTLDGKVLLTGIDLTLSATSRTMIMGANGAGKSLLLRLMHGLITPTHGTIAWGNTPMHPTDETTKAIHKRQAMVFQRPVLLRRSVAANIQFALSAANPSMPRAERGTETERLLDYVDLLDHASQPARLLSGGEQQRLALARALATRPHTLFLDEPTASLDPASARHIEDLVRDAHAGGTKIIFVTHDIGQARRLGNDVVFLHNGRLAEHAAADTFFDAAASDAARAYLEGRLLP